MASSRSTVFGGGATLGIATEVVTPPAAQAALSVSRSSLCSNPGTRWWLCMSTRPGMTSAPPASIVSSADGSVPGA